MTDVVLSLKDAHEMARNCLALNGLSAANAEATAANMVAAERDGCVSHGLFRLPGYVISLRAAKFDADAEPSIERIAPGVIRVDAHSGLAPLAVQRAQEVLAPLAREQGIAAAAIVRVFHMAALWPDVEPLADHGLAALALTASAS
ncbi:MAG: Ldh family oxidoreductase, partial [Rhodospirillaceae bacterium]